MLYNISLGGKLDLKYSSELKKYLLWLDYKTNVTKLN